MRRASHCGDFSRRATKRSRHSVARFVRLSGIEEMFRNGDPLSSAVLGAATRRQQSPTRGKEKAAEVKVQASGSPVEERGAGGEAHYAQVPGESAEANVDDADVKQENAEVEV